MQEKSNDSLSPTTGGFCNLEVEQSRGGVIMAAATTAKMTHFCTDEETNFVLSLFKESAFL